MTDSESTSGTHSKSPHQSPKKGRWARMVEKGERMYEYCASGVWRDTRDTWRVRAVKIGNLSVRGFMDADLQTQASALTFQTILAIVPSLALIFAIGRGFGFQNLIQTQLYNYFPSQHKALEMAFGFVDSYLGQASEGIFVGVGIMFLLWTLLSLLNSVETSLNKIWDVRVGRSIWRKMTDYLAIFLILPILMICAAGLSLLMSATLQKFLDFEFLKPAINWVLDFGSYIFTSLFFAGVYILIPNTKVRIVNALVAGACVGLAFQGLQWVFLTGQMYVAKYNAIYGSFSFLPLFLIWLQLVWLITLIGALLCYASQNAGRFNFYRDVDNISFDYRRKVVLTVMTIIAKRFVEQKKPLTASEIAVTYNIPVALVTAIVLQLRRIGLITFIEAEAEFLEHPLQPAVEVSTLTVGEIIRRLQTDGASEFIPGFEARYDSVGKIAESVTDAMIHIANETNIISINIDI
ncbi:MAG: YihY family inner membrane protein [Bacteroides sp.]|nr:YihY family inner membrane protein [Bacteroides sp.]